MSTVAKILLLEPAFQIDSLKYILGESESTDEKQETFSLANCKLPIQTNVLIIILVLNFDLITV